MALDQPLSDAEVNELAKFLESDRAPNGLMDLCTLDGYLTAIAIRPTTLTPRQWIPGIWGEGDEPGFDSLDHAKRIFDFLLRYYNQIIRTFMNGPEQFQPFLYEYEEDGETRLSVEEWSVGFSLGVHLRTEAWQPLLEDKQYQTLLTPMVIFSMQDFPEEVNVGHELPKAREELIAILPQAVRAIYAYWQPLREKRAHDTTADSFRPGGSSKTSRNAPCPCGSGKKFKKCCGTPRSER